MLCTGDGLAVGTGRGAGVTFGGIGTCDLTGRGVATGGGVTMGRGVAIGRDGATGRGIGNGGDENAGSGSGNRIKGNGAICGGRGTTG